MLKRMTELLFLGTGPAEAIPRMGHRDALCLDALKPRSRSRRLRSAAIVRKGPTAVLIDAGPDIAYQLTIHRVARIDAVLLTHAHLDAAAGLEALDGWARARNLAVPVYTEPATLYRYGAFERLDYRFVKSGGNAKIGGLPVRFFRVRHSLQPGFPTLGFRFGKLAYASDAASVPAPSRQKLHGVSTLVLDAAFWFGQRYRGHLTPDKSVRIARWLGVEHLVLTQTGHTYPPHAEAEAEVKRHARIHAPGLRVDIAYDGMRLRVAE